MGIKCFMQSILPIYLFKQKKGGGVSKDLNAQYRPVHVRRNEMSLSCEIVDQILENDFMLKT
jgi:hypothetical protein